MKTPPALFRLFLVFVSLGSGPVLHAARAGTPIDYSTPSGLVRHGEHWVDLVLAQGGASGRRHLDAFLEIARSLVTQASKGIAPLVNEKIDGSPSIVLGFTANGKPFVAYKGQLSRVQKAQELVTSAEDARRFFSAKPQLAAIYESVIRHVGPRMERLSKNGFGELVFQADLLFSEGQTRLEQTQTGLVIHANTIRYEVGRDSALFPALSKAKLGMVIHTVGRRVVDPRTGRISVKFEKEKSKVDAFASGLASRDIFAIAPWRQNVRIATERPLDNSVVAEVQALLLKIEKQLLTLSPEFREQWRTKHESKLRPFFNSGLRPPADGGIYRRAAERAPFDMAWVSSVLLESVEHKQELAVLIEAYYDAIQVQYLIQPSLSEMFRSVLGGSESEGVMLETEGTLVKLVDRLKFTIQNNTYRERPASLADFALFPEPFNVWRPGAIFLISKFQPIHAGHVAMIRRIVEDNPGREVFIIASAKAPNLKAESWRDLGAATTKGALVKGNYTHPFDNRVRKRILKAAQVDVPVYFLDTTLFNSYLRLAHSLGLEGSVSRAVGQKEIDQGRFDTEFEKYSPHLTPMAIEMQEEGISGTEVRQALGELSTYKRTKPAQAQQVLERAFSMVENPTERGSLCRELIRQWRAVNRKVRDLIP